MCVWTSRRSESVSPPPAPSCLCAQPVCHRLITGLGWGVRWGGGEGLFWGQILQRCKNAALAKRREILELSAVITPPTPVAMLLHWLILAPHSRHFREQPTNSWKQPGVNSFLDFPSLAKKKKKQQNLTNRCQPTSRGVRYAFTVFLFS